MKGLKCWKEVGMLPPRGIYGIDGKYVWQNQKNSDKIIYLSRIVGGRGTVVNYSGIKGRHSWGHHKREDAKKEALKYMKEHDTC